MSNTDTNTFFSMDPFRYREAYAAMLHTTQLIEKKLNRGVDLDEENPGQNVEAQAALQEQDPDSMDWTPTESIISPRDCGPPPTLSKQLRHLLPDGEYQAPDCGENAVLLHKRKEGAIMDDCIDKLARDLPDILSYDNLASFTPSTIEVPKDFGLHLSVSTNHHLAQVADRKALDKYRRLLGHRKDASKRKPVKLGFDPIDLIQKQAVAFAENVGTRVCTLDNDIHPIFRLENWHGCPDDIYEVLKPGMRLATLFLTSQATAHFWHTLVFGKRDACERTSEVYGQPCFRIREDVPWSEDRHATFKQFLENQLNSVHFFFHRNPLPPETAYASMALVKDFKNGLMRKTNHKCHTSRICLHSDFYTTAKKLSMLQYREPAMVLRFNVFLSICLSHEIAHFCEVSGPHHEHPLLSEPEVFLGDNMWTESGIAFETRVFGGRIHPLSSRIDCSHGIACIDYPLKELYDKDDNILYALPMDYILKLQQKETWQQDFTNAGPDIFFVPRTGGRSIEINGTNLMIWEDENDADISDHIDGRETRWKRMDDGSISKNPNSNNRKPQRQAVVQRWTPYSQKTKKNITDRVPCVSKVVEDAADHDNGGLQQDILEPEPSEDGVGGKIGSDQDMI